MDSISMGVEKMSPFGIIMFFIAIIWTFVVFSMISASSGIYGFIRSANFIWTIVGYVAIIVFTITAKRIAAR